MSQNPEAVVRAFFAEMGRGGGLISAIDQYCADHCKWENTGLPTAPDKATMKAMMQASIDGSEEVWSAILASILTHIAVFVPLLFLQGMEGRFFRPLGIAYITSILASLAVALTVTPALRLGRS